MKMKATVWGKMLWQHMLLSGKIEYSQKFTRNRVPFYKENKKNVYVLHDTASNCIKQKLIELQGEESKSTITDEDLTQPSLLLIGEADRKSVNIQDLKKHKTKIDLMAILGLPHKTASTRWAKNYLKLAKLLPSTFLTASIEFKTDILFNFLG